MGKREKESAKKKRQFLFEVREGSQRKVILILFTMERSLGMEIEKKGKEKKKIFFDLNRFTI